MPDVTTAGAGSGVSTGSTAATAGVSTLADEVGALMGDYEWASGDDTDTDESPESDPSSAAEAPSASAPDQTSETPADGSSTSPTQAAHAGAPPADATAASSTSSPSSSADDDLLQGASPLSYVVNGETRSFDGITQLGDKGAFITPEHLPKVQQRLSERDHLFEKSKADYESTKALQHRIDQTDSLLAWKATGQDGKEITYTGRDAIEARNVTLAQLAAEVTALREIVQSPDTMRELLVAEEQPDGTYKYSHNKLAFDNTQLRINERRTSATNAALRHLESLVPRTAFATAPRATTASYTPESIASIAPEAAKAVVSELQVTGLTDADSAFLADAIIPYIRPTTDEDRKVNPTLGPLTVDRKFTAIVNRVSSEAKARVQAQAEARNTARAVTQDATENARRLAAAAVGSRARPTTPARSTSTSSTSPTTPTDINADVQDAMAAAWKERERTIAAMM